MERSLLYLENLVLPSVIVITANIRCLCCQQRVSQLTSKITGLTEYTVDVNNKQVIIKGGFNLRYHLQNGKNQAIDESRLKKKLKQPFHGCCLRFFSTACATPLINKQYLT